MPIIKLDAKSLAATHDTYEYYTPGFMFHDLYGKPMMMNDTKVTVHVPKGTEFVPTFNVVPGSIKRIS